MTIRSYEDIHGWFSCSKLYDEAIRRAPPGSLLIEVGCWKGRSLAYLGQKVKESGKDLKVIGVDHGKGSPEHEAEVKKLSRGLIEELRGNLADLGLSDTVAVMVGESGWAAGAFQEGEVEFVYIDAAHEKASVLADLGAWWPKVRVGGWMAGHDYGSGCGGWPEVKMAVDEFYGKVVGCSPLDGNSWAMDKSPVVII